jgi:hypothetical protein
VVSLGGVPGGDEPVSDIRFSTWIANAERVLDRDLALQEILFLHRVWLESAIHRADAQKMMDKTAEILESA